MYNIVIVEDHPIMRQSLVKLVENEADLKVSAAVSSAEEARATVRRVLPDLVLVDISLPGEDGISLVQELRAEFPELPTLIISGHEAAIYGEAVIAAGAQGYVMKRHVADIIPAIRHVLNGEQYIRLGGV